MYMLYCIARGMKAADGIKFANQLMRWKDYYGLSKLAQYHHKGPYK